MPDVNQPVAEPSPVETEVQNSSEVPAMSTEERQTWRMTGKLPDQPSKQEAPAASDAPKEAESATAPTKEVAAKPAPASEPGKETQKTQSVKDEPQTIPYERFKEVVAEKNEWKRKAEAAAPKEAPKEQPKVEAKAEEYTPLDEEKFYAEHPDATLNDWIQASADHRAEWKTNQILKAKEEATAKAQAEAKQQEEHTRIKTEWNERITAAKKEHADFEAVAFAPDLTIPEGSPIDAWILSRPLGAKVLYALGKDRKELERISKLDPLSQTAELRDLELKLSKSPEKKPPARPVSAAPAPASSVAATETTPEDEGAAAVADNDFARFRAAENRKELARSGK